MTQKEIIDLTEWIMQRPCNPSGVIDPQVFIDAKKILDELRLSNEYIPLTEEENQL